mgnify:FL=1
MGMFATPIAATPGNGIAIQAHLFGPTNYMILAVLSGMTALALVMQIHILWDKIGREANSIRGAAFGGFGAAAGLFSSLFASATCGLCIGAIFSFLGFGTILFLLENSGYILAGAFLLLLASVYLSAKRIAAGCTACAIVPE